MPDSITPAPSRSFTVRLDSINVLNTRSAHKDTDYVALTVAVTPHDSAGRPFASLSSTLVRSLGDLAEGVRHIGLAFTRLKLGPNDVLTINYFIVNAGHGNPIAVEGALRSGGAAVSQSDQVIDTIAEISGLKAISEMGAGFFSTIGDLFGSIFSTPDCDGIVAAEQAIIPYATLLTETAQHALSRTTLHNGTDSPHGCGKNSVYQVTWSVQQEFTSHS